MAHLVGDLISYFQFDDINIDNWHFKMYYKGGTLLFFMGSMVGVLSQYFGEPIHCDFTTVDEDLAQDYCWIHGSSYIPVEYQHHLKCIADLEGVASEDDAPDTSYYQWVVFMMLLQAGMFYAPYKIWSYFESGLLASFGKDAKSAIIVSKENQVEGDDGVVLEITVNKFVKYFKCILHHNQWYFFKFVSCELLNVLVLYLNFWLTDQFLQGRFWYYGIDVIKYYRLTKAERKLVVSPFCSTFPTEVSCTVPNIGAAGLEQHHNGMCVLSQNILNEKIYLIIWWYLTVAILISFFFIFYRLATMFFEPLRFGLLYSIVSSRQDDDIKKSLRLVMSKCYLGDWFVLYQLGKNMNMYFMREFIKDLRRELVAKPKRSKSLGKGDGRKHDKMKEAEEGAKMLSRPTSPAPHSSAGGNATLHSLLCCCVDTEEGCRRRRTAHLGGGGGGGGGRRGPPSRSASPAPRKAKKKPAAGGAISAISGGGSRPASRTGSKERRRDGDRTALIERQQQPQPEPASAPPSNAGDGGAPVQDVQL